MTIPLDMESWSIEERCGACFKVSNLTVKRLESESGNFVWKCVECDHMNTLDDTRVYRIPVHVRIYIKAGKPRSEPFFEPHPLPWWKRLFRRW